MNMGLDCCTEFDNCPNKGKTVEEHCESGMHCTSCIASCGMEQAHDDHPKTCCHCGGLV